MVSGISVVLNSLLIVKCESVGGGDLAVGRGYR